MNNNLQKKSKFKPLPKCQTEKEALEQIRKALPSSFDKVKKIQVVREEDE